MAEQVHSTHERGTSQAARRRSRTEPAGIDPAVVAAAVSEAAREHDSRLATAVQVATLDGRVTNLEGNVTELRVDVRELKGEVAEVKSRLLTPSNCLFTPSNCLLTPSNCLLTPSNLASTA